MSEPIAERIERDWYRAWENGLYGSAQRVLVFASSHGESIVKTNTCGSTVQSWGEVREYEDGSCLELSYAGEGTLRFVEE